MTIKMKAKLRVCASCEWIFMDNGGMCPKCNFVSYGAHYVYGNSCYRYKKTQKYWLERKLFKYETELMKEVDENNKQMEKPKKITSFGGFKL
mgnify:CR=1 FL=1